MDQYLLLSQDLIVNVMAKQAQNNRNINRTICVIDTESAMRQRLDSVLQNPSWRVCVFGSMHDLLEQLDLNTPDCIIKGNTSSDVGLIDFFDDLQNRKISTPVIVLGENDDIPEAVLAMRAGAVDYISKPFTDSKLLRMVKRRVKEQHSDNDSI